MTDAASPTTGLPHAIRRQSWDVDVGDEELALALRPRLSDWNRRSWLPRIEKVLDELDSPGHHLRLRRLELDLGTFVARRLDGSALDELELLVGERLESALRQELRRALGGSTERLAGHIARIELFEHYLLRGTVPFWASRHGFRFRELLARLIDDGAEDVERVIRRHGHRQRVLRRLVTQLGTQEFHHLLQVLEPEHAALLIAYLLDVGRLHRSRRLVPVGARRLEHDLGVLTLSFLVTERGSRFNRKSYVRSLIRGLARSQGLLYADLLRTFGRSLGSATEKGARSEWLLRSSLLDLLRELLAELDAPTKRDAEGPQHWSVDRLRHELLERLASTRSATDTESGVVDRESEPRLDEMLLALAEHHPRSVRRFLESLRLRDAERRTVVAQSSPEAYQRMLEILAPEDAEVLGELVAALGRVPSPYRPRDAEVREAVLAEVLRAGAGRPLGDEVFDRILRRLFESPLPTPVASSLGRELAGFPAHGSEASRVALQSAVARAAGRREPEDGRSEGAAAEARGGHESSRRAVEPRPRVVGSKEAHAQIPRRGAHEAASARQVASEESEASYLDNAGLVLLAPFLPRLLEGLGVLEEGRICDVENASRAVHLLQYLVDGRLDASEPELVLPKVLCGWPVEQPVTTEIEPDDEDLVLCNGLLASVLGHWPSLAGSSVEALRETFLQRQGRLETKADECRLRVERKTVDVLMDDLPWGLSVVRHDAMDHPLYVNW